MGKIGKPKKKNIARAAAAPKMGLEQQITEGRIAKPKINTNKFRMRAEEEQVSTYCSMHIKTQS